jgi:uncharacterized protein YecE (DUF72 family)
MRIHVGTSGYSYKEWKGRFYPESLPASKMLGYYGEHFDTVEANGTFYRMPEASALAKWTTQVPDGFTFAVKAPQRITHQKKLAGASEDVAYLFETISVLGSKLGPVLFQLPPFSRKNAELLRDFIDALPRGPRVAFEFRHASWFDEEIFALLRERDIALCLADTDEVENPDTLVVPTASWGYLRLRRTEYTAEELAAWKRRIDAQSWSEAFLFFKHEDEAKGPRFAVDFLALRDAAERSPQP